MCGIVGYIGTEKASPILLKGLKRLEYRGYDSCGGATIFDNDLCVKKDVGKINDVHEKLNFLDMEGNNGIVHTRWAVVGGVTKQNAHPHTDCHGNMAVVHNGIIENYEELKKELKNKGHEFKSQCDTEVIPHLIEEYLKDNDLKDSVIKASKRLEGSFAFLVLNKKEPDKIIAVRYKCPLVLGISEKGNFATSDPVSFLEHTKNAVFLDEGELAVLTKNNFNIINIKTGEEIKKEVEKIEWNIEEAQKAGYEHFTIKEICEQVDTIEKALQQDKEKLEEVAREINRAFGIFFVACGTSYHACVAISYLFAKIAKKHINITIASEFPNFSNFLTGNTLMVAVSQSGETADVLEAVRAAKSKGVKVVAITNVVGSTLARMADYVLFLNSGPEISVVATKTYTSQLVLLSLLAYTCDGKFEEGKKEVEKITKDIKEMLTKDYLNNIKDLADGLKDKKDIFLIGRNSSFATALEGALKIKEISYIHAEGLAGGELKHGTLALIEKGTPCIAIIPEDETKIDILNNVSEIKARGANIIGIGSKMNKIYDKFIKVNYAGPLSQMATIIPIQILAYYLAVLRGCNPDYPRSLAKCVTVK